MTIPASLFGLLIWVAIGAVGAAAVTLLYILILEWRRRDLW